MVKFLVHLSFQNFRHQPPRKIPPKILLQSGIVRMLLKTPRAPNQFKPKPFSPDFEIMTNSLCAQEKGWKLALPLLVTQSASLLPFSPPSAPSSTHPKPWNYIEKSKDMFGLYVWGIREISWISLWMKVKMKIPSGAWGTIIDPRPISTQLPRLHVGQLQSPKSPRCLWYSQA